MPDARSSYVQHNDGTGIRHLKDIEGRLQRFIGGEYAAYNLSSVLFTHRLDDQKHVSMSVWSAPGRSKPNFEHAVKQRFHPTQKGDSYGPPWTNHWLKITLNIPRDWSHYERVQFEFDGTGEGLIYTTEGEPVHGLTGGGGNTRRVEYIIPDEARATGSHTFYIELSCNEMFGQSRNGDSNDSHQYPITIADLVVLNMEAQRLLWDFDALVQLHDCLPEGSALAMKAQWTANEIMNIFDRKDLASLARCRKVAQKVLGEDWESNIAKDAQAANKGGSPVWALGHCHIDTGWLWPFSVTQQKSARSWSTQVNLMERYPEYNFTATQAQQYAWLEKLYPSLFSRIQKKVEQGTFQPIGCTWVEMDTNMPSGEALCRQFLYGQRYYESRFGFRSKTCVTPDTFGYCGQLPQIIRLSGAQDFFTIKLSWSLINTFPHSTFNWVGIDGSQVLCHMAPTNDYGSEAKIDAIYKTVAANKNLDATSQGLLMFGNGDGGGGPNTRMLESLRRGRAIAKAQDAGGALPMVRSGGTMPEFFDAIREETNGGKDLPVWRGEMYLEFHRGTYTTHAAIKNGNRRCELKLQEAEYAASIAKMVSADFEYPWKTLDSCWEDLLLCQFHDVLPGSGIAMLYEDAIAKYERILESTAQIIENAAAVLHPYTSTNIKSLNAYPNAILFATNTLPGYPRKELLPVSLEQYPTLAQYCVQRREAGNTGYLMLDSFGESAQAVNAVEASSLRSQDTVVASKDGADCHSLKSSTVSLCIENGRIRSFKDLVSNRELISEGMTGGLVIMEDLPNQYDAWEVESFHLQKQQHLSFENVKVLDEGPHRGTLGATVYLDKSRIDVEISLDAHAASDKQDARSMVRFKAKCNWRQAHEFLKFELPLNIHADNATFDSAFGVVQRPTHRNTSWDAAKFEVCSHKFADLSEYGYGVAIINDSKYGSAVTGNVMTLSLLRSPKQPDPTTDMEMHEINWAVYPHSGGFAEGDVVRTANIFNSPLTHKDIRVSPTAALHSNHPLAREMPFKVEGADNVFLDTIKMAEETRDSGSQVYIIRLHEKMGGFARVQLATRGLRIKSASLVNILEDKMEDLSAGKDIELEFRRFEIKTVKIEVEAEREDTDDWLRV